MSEYAYLVSVSGTTIKPVTDLAAINMTTTNGIQVEQVNGGTIGIQRGYIESCYFVGMMDPAAGPAVPTSSYQN